MWVALIAAVVTGAALLAFFSDLFVLGSAGISRHYGVSAVVVGAVIVGFGTSAPELLVSGIAAFNGNAGVGLGNIVGSNAANITLILGIAALVAPLAVPSRVVRREAPFALGAGLLFALVMIGGLSRLDAVLLAVAMAVFLVATIRGSSTTDPLAAEADEFVAGHEAATGRLWLRTGLGLLGTLGGAQLLVWGAAGIADEAGVSEGLVGLTLVAIGTSLPELVTAVQASRKGEGDLVIGNLLGSNVFNALAVGAVVGLLDPGARLTSEITVALVYGTVAAAVVWLLMATQRSVNRLEGALLLGSYVALVPFLF
jgi:cation:H+ antiporter